MKQQFDPFLKMWVAGAAAQVELSWSALWNLGRYTAQQNREKEIWKSKALWRTLTSSHHLPSNTHTYTGGDAQWYNLFCLVRVWKYKGYCTAKLFTLTPLYTQNMQREVFWSDNWLWARGFVRVRNSPSWILWAILQLVNKDLCLFIRIDTRFVW